jgi:predicted ATP-dependent Lon-type protease
MSVADAKKLASEITKKANYGDVLIYFATPEPRGTTTGTYRFHAQIYTGNQYNGTGWSTSTKNNYGVSFVYGSKAQQPYTMYWFRIKDEYKQLPPKPEPKPIITPGSAFDIVFNSNN